MWFAKAEKHIISITSLAMLPQLSAATYSHKVALTRHQRQEFWGFLPCLQYIHNLSPVYFVIKKETKMKLEETRSQKSPHVSNSVIIP